MNFSVSGTVMFLVKNVYKFALKKADLRINVHSYIEK